MPCTMLHVDCPSMYCPVGTTTASGTAAMRAGMDHFRMLKQVDPAGAPLVGAYVDVPDLSRDILTRLGVMTNECITASLAQLPADCAPSVTLILLTPEPSRPGIPSDIAQRLFQLCTANRTFHGASRICPEGKAAAGPALLYAKEILQRRETEQVLIVGVDSYVHPDSLQHFVQNNRLLTSIHSDGFIPGEGAGAVVLSIARPDQTGLRMTGIGCAMEPGHLMQDILPNQALGLTHAIRAAVAESAKPLSDTAFHCGDCSGEALYFRESSEALLRCMEQVVPSYPHIVPASCLGETGAAAMPLMLVYMSRLLGREDGFGRKALLHWSADTGQRTAAICEWHQPGE